MNKETKAAMAGLNPMERRLVDAYLLTGKRKQSALDAGYSPASTQVAANRVLNRPEVVKAMQARMDERSERVDIKADFVLQGIRNLILKCEKGQPVYSKAGTFWMVQNPDDPEGDLIPRCKPDIAGALRGYELLGKHLKLFTEHHEVVHSGEVGVKHTVEAIGFDDIKRLADQKKEKVING